MIVEPSPEGAIGKHYEVAINFVEGARQPVALGATGRYEDVFVKTPGTPGGASARLFAVDPAYLKHHPWVKALGGDATSVGKTVAWPVGIGGKGNEGVSAVIGQTEGGIGYVELAYATAQHLTYAVVKNKAGAFIEPCVKTAAAATVGITDYPADLRVDIVDATENADAYPITGLTWVLIYEKQTKADKAAALNRSILTFWP